MMSHKPPNAGGWILNWSVALQLNFLFLFWSVQPAVSAGRFVHFESAPVHPIALSPDGSTLAICNLPDSRVELFTLTNGLPIPAGNVAAGIEPVSLQFRNNNELWVVNHISSSVNIIDLSRRRVVAVLPTFAGPADIVFAGNPQRAFVSCARSNVVMVFDPVARVALTNVAIDGDRPKALEVSPDGSKVYVAVFESGNASTILGARLTLDTTPESLVDNTNGPYHGQNPPPNFDNTFNPPIGSNLLAATLPVSHLVRKNSAGRWLDDNQRDWTEFVSGPNAALSGRVPGWDMPDHDLGIIDTESLDVTYISRLMNICMQVAVNPVTGRIAVVGTDAQNERRFEPNLKSTFLRVQLALIDPSAATKLVKDLNPHLDYTTRSIPASERARSIGDPRGAVWTADGTRCFVTGMGSGNILVLDANGNRIAEKSLAPQEGPTGICLDENRSQLYVLNRFSSSVSVVELQSLSIKTNIAFFDPTPPFIKSGRRLLYDTHANSGLGHVSCASCHVDGRFDRLAWDLGDPTADFVTNQFGVFHPMKGPKVTQTLQALNPQGALHWRADREGIQQFSQTFVALLGRDTEPSAAEMEDFGNLLQSMFFPPNPLRNFDNTVSTNLPLPGQYAYEPVTRSIGTLPLPNGNALRGGNVFASGCAVCHNPGSGLGDPSADTITSRLDRNFQLPFKTAQLRSLADKLGFEMSRPLSRAGFGFSHDGRADTITRLIGDGFNITNVQDAADLTAFLLSFSGSDNSYAGLEGFENIEGNLDGPAALGHQLLLTNSVSNSVLLAMMALTQPSNSRLELVASGRKDGLARGWFYDPANGWWRSDRDAEYEWTEELLELAAPTNELVFMMVAQGTGERMGIDHDSDSYPNRSELDYGLDPDDAASRGPNKPVYVIHPTTDWAFPPFRVHSGVPLLAAFLAYSRWEDELAPSKPVAYTWNLLGNVPSGLTMDRTTGQLSWSPDESETGKRYRFSIVATDNGAPSLSGALPIEVEVIGPVRVTGILQQASAQRTLIFYAGASGRRYQIQYTDHLPSGEWQALPDWFYGDPTWPFPKQRFYRVLLLPEQQ